MKGGVHAWSPCHLYSEKSDESEYQWFSDSFFFACRYRDFFRIFQSFDQETWRPYFHTFICKLFIHTIRLPIFFCPQLPTPYYYRTSHDRHTLQKSKGCQYITSVIIIKSLCAKLPWYWLNYYWICEMVIEIENFWSPFCRHSLKLLLDFEPLFCGPSIPFAIEIT